VLAPTVEPAFDDPVEEIREATLTPLASNEIKATVRRIPGARFPRTGRGRGHGATS